MSARTPNENDAASGVPHLIVRASAGTGKTYTLSSRYLKLLHLGADPQTILATTFTRKAAGEILERVLSCLAEAAGNEKAAAKLGRDLRAPVFNRAEAQRMLGVLCRSLHRVWVSTIDSLFNRIVQSFRHELGVPPNPILVADGDPRAAQLRGRAIDALLAEDEPQVLIDLLRRLHFDQAQRSVAQAIDAIVGGALYEVYRQAPDKALWTVLAPPPPDVPAGVDATQRVQAAAELEALAETVRDARFAKALRDNREQATQGRWEEFLDKGLAKAIAAGQATYYKKDIPENVLAAYRPLIDMARAELVGRIARQTAATHDLLERFDRHYTALRRQNRVMLFSDLAQKLARELPQLGDELLTEVYYRLDRRVGHLLLDEFQDTSLEQWQVLRPFAQEVRAYADGSRSFFCVGDVKQAIYGWRGGCAEVFALVEEELSLHPSGGQSGGRESGGGGAHPGARLNKSYRSSPIVLEAVNAVFGTLETNPALAAHVESAERWAAGFETHTAEYADRPGYVELVTSTPGAPEAAALTGDDEAEDPGAGEDGDGPAAMSPTPHENYAAGIVRDIVQAAPTPGSSIGVLVSTNAMVRRMIYVLRGLGIPASGEGGNPVTDDPAVQAVLAALTLADHPGDTVAAFHVVNSPLGAVVGLTAANPHAAAATALSIRRALLSGGGGGGGSYARVIADWARRLAPSCEARQVRRLTQLVELAERYEEEMSLRPGRFVEFVRATPVQEPSPAPVRVMTVHRAKGLEFDAVVLPELDRLLGRTGGQAVYVERATPTAPISAVFRAASKTVRGLSPRLEAAYAAEFDRRMQDDLSALYVALTRARHALYLVVQPLQAKKDGTPGSRGLTNRSAAAILRQALRPEDYDEGFDGNEVLYERGERNWAGVLESRKAGKQPFGPELTAEGESTTSEPAPDHLVAAVGREPRRSAEYPSDQLTEQPINQSTIPGAGARRSWRMVTPSSLESAGRVSVRDLLTLEASAGRLRGSVIHALMAQVEYLAPAAPGAKAPGSAGLPDDAALLSTAQSAWRQAAPGTVVDAKMLGEWVSQFKKMIAHPAVRHALSRPGVVAVASGANGGRDARPTGFGGDVASGGVELWRERPFAVRRGDYLLQGVFDRVTVHRKGARIERAEIMDFKTDRVAPHGENLAALVEQYRPQMQAYRAALGIMLNLKAGDIAARMVFLDAGIVREV